MKRQRAPLSRKRATPRNRSIGERALSGAEKVELTALALAAAAGGALSFPRRVALADLLLDGAAFLLLQGLIRDLWRIRRERAPGSSVAGAPVRCVCVESTVGVGAFVSGSFLLFAWTPIVFEVSRVAWPVAIAALGAFGFLTKDLVLDWRARRLMRGPNHREQVRPPASR
jgi:hypothetical protein